MAVERGAEGARRGVADAFGDLVEPEVETNTIGVMAMTQAVLLRPQADAIVGWDVREATSMEEIGGGLARAPYRD